MFDYEQVRIQRGARSGFPIIAAIHSTALGPAIGGCRLWRYPDWRDGLTDALRLAKGMTLKNAAAKLAHGGGKTVIALPPGAVLDGAARRDVLLDVGEVVESFAGQYATGPDVGTSTWTVTVIGLGHVGAHLARNLARDGAQLLVTDIDESRRGVAAEIGATWCEPGAALTAEADLLVPAALGGQLTAEVVPALRCRAIVGPANNQLADDGVARLLHERGIRWVPDYLASAGGVTYAVARELHGAGLDEARHQVLGIGAVTEELLRTADRLGTDPHQAALGRVREQLAAAASS